MASKRKIYFKCPYCNKEKFEKDDLVIHVGDDHDEMIPKDYSAFRVVFDYVNNKPSGYNGICVICGKESGWDEDKGRYNRICSNKKCKEAFIKQFEKNMNNKYGYSRISSTEEGQEKMLANRKISGKYKFSDGIEKVYTGSYEKNALEFMDKVLHINSEDLFAPGPNFKYNYNGKNHIYISDMYYAPYNLIIEVKDGGDNPNKRNMQEYREKQIAKENYIIKNTNYNYIRLTNNDFSQLLAVFMDLKMSMNESNGKDRVIHVNESYVFNEPDIYYNKDKFDSGEINLCFITGLSGSGKSTMGKNMSSNDNIEHYELDDIYCNSNKGPAERFTMDQYKEYGDLIYSFFKTEGKKYYLTMEEINKLSNEEYEYKLFVDFCEYAMKYASSHKDKKFVIEGIYFYLYNTFSPSMFDDYAFYIKGTSAIVSKIRAAKRNAQDAKNNFEKAKTILKDVFNFRMYKYYFLDEKNIKVFRDYFSKKIKSNVNEASKVNNEKYYRYEYEGIGIYEALKQKVGLAKWKQILASGVMSWLPKPPEYKEGYNSYFTEDGNKKFKETVYPICIKYLDKSKIKESSSYIDANNIIYRDKYQIVIKININETMNGLMTGFMPGISDSGCSYIVNYMQNNAFSQGYSHDIKLHNLIIRDDNDKTLKKADDEFDDSLKIDSIYKVKKDPKEVYEIFNSFLGKEVSEHFIYETVFNHKYYDEYQIRFENIASESFSFNEEQKIIEKIIKESLLGKNKLDLIEESLSEVRRDIYGC